MSIIDDSLARRFYWIHHWWAIPAKVLLMFICVGIGAGLGFKIFVWIVGP